MPILFGGDDEANGFDLRLRFKPHFGLSFLENQNGVGVQYTYNNNIQAFIYPKNMFAGSIGIEIGPDFCWHFNKVSFGFYPYVGESIEGGLSNFKLNINTINTIYIISAPCEYANSITTFGIAPYVKVKKFTVSLPVGISINSGNCTVTIKDINNKTISYDYDFTYIDAFCKIEIGFLF